LVVIEAVGVVAAGFEGSRVVVLVVVEGVVVVVVVVEVVEAGWIPLVATRSEGRRMEGG